MPLYECNEHQFVENLRRLLEAGEKFIVNRRTTMHDDAKYGPATLPEEEFARYETLCTRKAVNSTVYAKVPFIDVYHGGRMHDAEENLHSSTALKFPRMSIPYFRIEYSVNVWGGTYFFAFDALFDPEIVIEKRSGRRLGKGALVHVLRYNPPKEQVLSVNLPKGVVVLDVKHMVRVIDHTSNF
ncbi:hypothetical protein NTE_03166 [Candidatus Nitrososphaera evergladensis SR1]|uniref:Uncharacterized protein n=1 Tax=Candidatus Nitrososphaera evergladensis SR1 TaxID=1459636 RepID=A0A075MVK8_9ARCH|nr:hypothetical protein [Candidatus Nitrososphaera evergladensis]AIF85198.1 hypothetical protein NTE_03166 [Candidatus Nitrososphaera evergladensis SR1]